MAFHDLRHRMNCKPGILRAWKALFKKFCVEEDSEIFEIICSQFRDYKSQEQFQIILLHQFNRGYLISEEFFFLYADLVIKDCVPLSAVIFGEERFLREDEKYESYLHPSDIFSINVPKLWKKVFYNELFMYNQSFVTNSYIQPQLIKILNVTTRAMYGPEKPEEGLSCLESQDLRPP